MNAFLPGDLLLPRTAAPEQWAVIACDQFTSDPGYWQRVRERVADAPSTLNMVLPEAELAGDISQETARIHRNMEACLEEDRLCCYPGSYIYVERTTARGKVRRGIVGVADLEQYDYRPDTTLPIRATEQTVLDRLPVRERIRCGAPLEFSHVLLLCDDDRFALIEPISLLRDALPKLYDFDLMEGGGHISGWLLDGENARYFDSRLEAYCAAQALSGSTVFAVGDGNHSLAAAKNCYEQWKLAHPGQDTLGFPGRYAMVELENIHDPVQQFEPIHRIITHTCADALLSDLKRIAVEDGCPIQWIAGENRGTVYVDAPSGERAVGVLQAFLDKWLQEKPGQIDYIHGDARLTQLASQENAVGFLLPAMEKSGLFRAGVLPRKTFSMGHAEEKRYYMEGRKIL